MRKFRIVANGYDMNEVNQFIDMVITRMENLTKENTEQLKLIGSLKTKVNDTADVEKKLEQAILAVQETSDRMKELARTESKMIIEDAKRNANAIVHEALINAEKTEYEANLLRKNIKVYKERIRGIIESQLKLTDDLDKFEL